MEEVPSQSLAKFFLLFPQRFSSQTKIPLNKNLQRLCIESMAQASPASAKIANQQRNL